MAKRKRSQTRGKNNQLLINLELDKMVKHIEGRLKGAMGFLHEHHQEVDRPTIQNFLEEVVATKKTYAFIWAELKGESDDTIVE